MCSATGDRIYRGNPIIVTGEVMPAFVKEGDVFFGISIPLVDFERLATAHLRAFPTTPKMEELGRLVVERDFAEPQVRDFIKQVCTWGNYPGIAGRVLKRNPLPNVCEALKAAFTVLERQDATDIARALRCVNMIRGLGEPSFASKHLRFLKPSVCPVFDSLLREALPYSFDPDGYGEFARDCSKVATAIEKAHVPNPNPEREGTWFAADVESALYALVADLAE
jgi:hypothetical protein